MTADAPDADFEVRLKRLWLLAAAGDERAYRDALALIAVRLRGYFVRRLFGWPDDVEDMVQETLLALHLKRGTYDPALPVSAWVHAIARHKFIDLLRRRGRETRSTESLDLLDDRDDDRLPTAAPDEGPVRRDLATLLQTLPPAQRDAIVMIKIEGLSVAEASARSGVSVSALKVQVHRGLKRLAESLRRVP